MISCTQCGHQLGPGRFCTNCGHPVVEGPGAHAAGRTDTAERPKVTAPVTDRPAPPRPATSAPVLPPPPPGLPPEPPRHRTSPPAAWLPWVAGFVLLAIVAGVGAWLLFGGGDREPVVAQEARTSDGAGDRPRSPEPRETSATQSPSEPATSEPAEPGPIDDLTRLAEVVAPAPAPASRDTSGDVVRYVAGNLVDGSPDTCWRMTGDGTGASITFHFEGPVRLTEVGLINGYAKRTADDEGVLDWYAGNRRVREVEWTFGDGTVVTQELGDTTEMQTVGLEEVETEWVTLRMLEVTPPGPGRASRDYTPISDVRLVGATLT